jgi:hypothetical protein
MAAKRDPLEGIGLALKGARRSAATVAVRQAADPRAGKMALEGADDAALRARAIAVLAEAGIRLDREATARVGDAVVTLRNDANVVHARMVTTGRALLALQEAAGEGGYRALHKAGIVRFSEATASRLRQVAAAVDARKVAVDVLPKAVQAAAMVAALPKERIEELVAAGVVHRDASTGAIKRAVEPPTPVPPKRRKLTPDERRRLERLRDRLLARLREIEARLAQG